jgi:tricorn protease
LAFSPDSKYVAFNHNEPTWITQVYLYEISTGKAVRVSNLNVNSQNPAFSSDGKFLLYVADSQLTPMGIDGTHKYAFDSMRRVYMVALSPDTASPFLPKNDEEGASEKPSAKAGPVSMDGLGDRVIEVPMAAGRYQQVGQVGLKLLLINWAAIPAMDGAPEAELQAFDVDKKSLSTLAGAIDSFDVSADGKKLLLHRGAAFAVADAGGGPVAFSPVNLGPYSITINPEKEWNQIFEESWRVARDFFYDPNMHGVDWNKVHRKYESMLPLVGDRTDLSRLQADLVSELNSGHAYISNPSPRPPMVGMGYLGADLKPVGDAVQIVKLFRGDGFAGNRSPLLQPGLKIKEGDYIVTVAGQVLRSDTDIQALLIGTAGQTVALGINDKPTVAGARVVEVQPVGSEDGMRYTDWVQGREEYVHKHGGDDLGYLHVPDMGGGGLVGFTKGQFPNVLKPGMIYDFRYNGGGYVSSLLLENVAARPQAWFKPRDGDTWTREDWANLGYHIALCNEENFSDGELVIEDWKRMKLGPVVGKRTGGGEVGSGGGYSLIDHGLIYVPNYGAFADGKWIIEGAGAMPDIEVDQDPGAVIAGKDPQLDKAIEVLRSKIAKEPIKKPATPPFPIKAG